MPTCFIKVSMPRVRSGYQNIEHNLSQNFFHSTSLRLSITRGGASLHLVSQHAWELYLRIQSHSPQNPSTWKEVFSPSFSQFIYISKTKISWLIPERKNGIPFLRGGSVNDKLCGCKTTDAVRTGAAKKDDRKERKWMRWWGWWKILRRLSRRRLKVCFYFIFLIIYIHFGPRPNKNPHYLNLFFWWGADKIELCPLLSLSLPEYRLFSFYPSPPNQFSGGARLSKLVYCKD